MDTLPLYLAIAATALATVTVLGVIGLKAFRGWLELKHAEIGERNPAPPTASQRIDVADLKERIRKLEAIALGVDL